MLRQDGIGKATMATTGGLLAIAMELLVSPIRTLRASTVSDLETHVLPS